MSLVAGLIRLVLAGIALRGVRWAYVAFIVAALAYFPMKAGAHMTPTACEGIVNTKLAMFSFTNYPHIVLFCIFFVFSSAQTGRQPSDRTVLVFCSVATLLFGALLELAEGVSGMGHCRLRDLLPDAAGATLGAVLLVLWRRLRSAPTLNPFVRLRFD